MPKYFSPSLPYRRLQKFANGIWDEERKTFYPYICAMTTVPAKRGISYFVHSVTISNYNNNDKAAGEAYIEITNINGSVGRIIRSFCPATVTASNVNASSSLSSNPDILCKSNSPITVFLASNTGGCSTIVYAEIPTDGEGIPVVIT